MAAVLASGFAGQAHAADAEDKRKALSANQFDQSQAQSEEYAKMAEAKRMESIQRLKELLNSGPEGDTKAEMMMRLADLYFQQGKYLYLGEMAAFDKAYDACFNTQGCDAEHMVANNSGSREWQDKSIKLYQAILANYPRYARADQATFFLGSAQWDTNQKDDAVEAFKRLVKLYPQSEMVPDAYVLIGEYFFDQNNAYAALSAYQKAAAYKDHPKWAFASYKLAWCYYNVGEYQTAIDTLKSVVSFSMAKSAAAAADPGAVKGNLALEEEALKDLVRVFADADQIDEAYSYFTSLGKKDLIRSVLVRLASTAFEQGKFDKAVDMYRRLILDDPTNKGNPEYQFQIIQCYRKTAQNDLVIQEVNKLLSDYNPTSSWAQANAANPEAVKDADEKIEETLRRTAVDYHNEAKTLEKGRHPSAASVYELARGANKTYLDHYPKSEHAYDVRYAYGELLYHVKDFAGAFDQYMAVVDMNPQGDKSKFCGESAIFAAEEQVKLEGGAAATGTVTVDVKQMQEPQPLSAWEQRLVDACKKYATLWPGDKKVQNIIYKSAYLLYNKYRFPEAAEQFNAVIKIDPSSSAAEQAANLVLDSFVIRKDYANLKTNAKLYYDQQGLGSQKFKDDVYKIYQNASFKLIEVTYDKDKDAGKAADSFVAFYNEFPNADVGAQALNNASVYYTQVDRVGDAMNVRHILIDDPKYGPKTKYYYDQISALGYEYEQIADFGNAATYYEKMWSLYPAEKTKAQKEKPDSVAAMDAKAADAIYSAAVLRNGNGQWEQAITNYNQFIAAFPADSRVPDVLLTIGKVYEDHEKWTEAGNVFLGFYTKPPATAPQDFVYFARLHYGLALEKTGQAPKATKLYEETVALWKKGGETKGPESEFVAEMMFKLAQPTLDSYMAMQVTSQKGASRKIEDKSLLDSLNKKTQALLKVTDLYQQVVNTGAGEWGLAALVQLGRAYENMGDALKNSDRPSYLNASQLEMYNMGLEDRVYPQTEKAAEAYKLALQKSYELTLYNENTEFATQRLGVLKPQEYQALSEQLLEPRYTSSKIRKYEPETSL
jgi:tetratricopeptide (TPR) repeat protein